MGKIDKLRILLIFPPLTALPADYPTPDPPLGLAYIAAVLEKHGFDIKILDAFAEAECKSNVFSLLESSPIGEGSYE